MHKHWPYLRIALTLGIITGGLFTWVSLTYADDPLEVVRLPWATKSTVKQLPSQLSYDIAGCTDTDGGANTTTRGTVTVWPDGGPALSYTDSCVDGSRLKLTEYTCSGTSLQSTVVTCPAGCSNGACQQKGTVYFAYTIDTEVRFFDTTQRSQTLDMSDYNPDHLVDMITQDDFRNQFYDSFGNRAKFSWFFLSAQAYCVSAQADCTAPYDAFAPYRQRAAAYGDQVDAWHYHHQGWSDRNNDGRFFWNQLFTFNGSPTFDGTDQQLAEKMLAYVILQKRTFPSVFRTGWAWQSTDISNWFDDVLPFDFSNLSPQYNAYPSLTLDNVGNYFNWQKAPQNWTYYHPAATDYQLPGSLKRYQFRTHNGPPEWEKAFQKAQLAQDQFVVIATHNYNEQITMEALLTDFSNVAAKYPDVPFRYVTALEGARLMADRVSDTKSPSSVVTRVGNLVTVSVDEPLFTYPYGAVKAGGAYLRVQPQSVTPLVDSGKYSWTYDLAPYVMKSDSSDSPAASVDASGSAIVTAIFSAGGTDPSGNTFVTATVGI